MAPLSSAILLVALSTTAFAHPPGGPGYGTPPRPPHHGSGQGQAWNLKKFTTLVAFGDSYTDDSRLGYFALHNGSAPPVGWVNPANYMSASGGRPWPQYVKQYTGINLYNYAVSGAVCSNDITPRTFAAINADFPAIQQYEVPAYIADSKYVEPNGVKFLIAPQDETVYSMWIGTNDLGNYAFLTDSQVPGTNITSMMDCVFTQLKRIYDNGGRYFVLQNVAPVNLAPLYATPEAGGVGPNHYWTDKPSNLTEISYRMMEQVVTVNSIYEYRTPFMVKIKKSFPGAKFAVMDMHGLITDIYNNPSEYLNGTAPLSVTGFDQKCNITGVDCVRTNHPDSFLWFDELHPSEQTDRVIARNFVDVVKGASKYATYWSS